MRICFIGDANSITARRWVEHFCEPENEVIILSSSRNPKPIEGAKVYDLYSGKLAVPGARGVVSGGEGGVFNNKVVHSLIWAAKNVYENKFVAEIRSLYYTFRLAGRARAIIKKLQPDLVHCIRLPIEGYIGGLVGYRPLAISSWGQDFVLFANKYLPFRWLTKKALKVADIHFTDNARDTYLAEIYGFSPLKLTYEVPGCGGLKLDELPQHHRDNSLQEKTGISPDTNLLLSPRGTSYYINNRALVLALPRVIERFPNTLCLLIGEMRSPSYPELKTLVESLKIEKHCQFINRLEPREFLDYLAASDIMISASLYDGCPNSVLEAMACGAIPVMSVYCPVKEWITDGWNGYFFDPMDPENIAKVVIKALENKDSFAVMGQRNRQIVKERADYETNMKVVEMTYHELIKRTLPTT